MIKILDEKNISSEAREKVEEISKLPGVKEVVVFPDVHLKPKYTNLGYRIDIPSSLAILTEGCLYPQFRSEGINCGMTLLKTSLFYQDSLLPELEKVVLVFNRGLIKNLFNFFRFPLRDKFSLSSEAFQRLCQQGVPKIDYALGIRPEWQQGNFRLKRKMGRHFGGNHFLEFQVVDDIFDQKKAGEWRIRKGQIFILFHTAGDSLDDILEGKICQEIIHQPYFVKLEQSSQNAKIILKAIKILMNYGFAYRKTTFTILNDLFSQIFGKETVLEYFVDQYHNGIEEIKKEGGNTSFLYRHNVNKISEGSPVILSGLYNLRSYVNKGMVGAENFLWSVDHGYGDLVKNFPSQRSDNLKVKRIMFKKGLNLPFFIKKEEIDFEHNLAADHLLSLFEKNDISRRVFSLRPIINFKFI